MPARTLALLLPLLPAALTLAGCAAGPGPRLEPETESLIPSHWDVEAGDSETGSAGVDSQWFRGFEDSHLERVIGIALASNRDLRSAAARLDAAVAQARIAGADLQPQAGLSVNGARSRQNFIGLPIPGAEGGVLSNTSTNLGASLNVSWEADLWGRLRAGRNAATLRASAAAADLADAGLSIAGQTAKAWFALLEAAGQVKLAEETLDTRTRVRERIERRYRSGLRTALDLRLSIANEANAAAGLARRERQLDLAASQLEILTGRDREAGELVAETALDRSRELPRLPTPPALEQPAEILRRRPDVKASEARLSAAGLDVARARALLYPRLTLTGSSGRSSNQLEDLTDTDFSIWSLAVGVLQPLFQGGRLRAGVELARAGERDLLARHEATVIGALTDIQSRLAAEGFLEDQHAALARAAEASAAARDIAQDRYFTGLSGYLEVLAAEASATAAASELLAVERQRLDQRVDLYLALGGGLPPAPPTRETPAARVSSLSAIEDTP